MSEICINGHGIQFPAELVAHHGDTALIVDLTLEQKRALFFELAGEVLDPYDLGTKLSDKVLIKKLSLECDRLHSWVHWMYLHRHLPAEHIIEKIINDGPSDSWKFAAAELERDDV